MVLAFPSGEWLAKAVVDKFQSTGGSDAECVEIFAMKGHGVFADGEVCSTEIGVQALAGIHGLKGVGGGRWGVGTGKEWSRGTDC